jgi:UDP-2-acetamido-3-amino-2,3-dideoxy-glucuronate N-acetyltransferase
MSKNAKTVAVIGCGYWGKNIVRNFAELGALRAVCDSYAPLAAAMSSQFSAPAVSLEEIESDPSVQGVAIASPAPVHAELATRFLKAGKHVFVEKPVALEMADAATLVTLARAQNRLLMVGHLLQYHPGFLRACALVEAGQIGALRHVYSNRLSFGKVRTEENVLWSFAPHDISMILRLAGSVRPVGVSAFGGGHISPGIEDFCTVNLRFESGITAHIFVSWQHPFKEQRLVAIGGKGAIVFDDTAPKDKKLALYRNSAVIENGQPVLSKADAEYVPFEDGEPLRNECQSFLNGMSNPASVFTNGEEGLRVLDVLSRAELSMRAGSQ